MVRRREERSPVEGSSKIDNSLVSEMSSTAKAPVKQTQAPQNGKQVSAVEQLPTRCYKIEPGVTREIKNEEETSLLSEHPQA